MIDSKDLRRIYFQAQLDFSNTTTLNTPIELFSGGHSHPDSVLSLMATLTNMIWVQVLILYLVLNLNN